MKKGSKKTKASEAEVQKLASQARKFGYLSFFFGIFCGPIALYYWYRTEAAIRETHSGKKYRKRAQEGRTMALFGTCLWLALVYIQWGELPG